MTLKPNERLSVKSETIIIPVVIKHMNWGIAPYAKLQALPKDGKAIELRENRDSACRNVSEEIERVVNQMRKR